MSFHKLNLSPELVQAVEKLGYTQPTQIQSSAIPSVLMGRDVLGCAQTGTGKTASFLLPIIDVLVHDRSRAGMPRCVVLTPTRELAIQISAAFDGLAAFSGLRYAVLVGGSSPVIQERELAKGPDILIATPGRLLDMHERGKIMFLDVKMLVLDEADRMLDMGFMPDIERLLAVLPKKRQSLLFSATMPQEIKLLADKMLNNPHEISITPKEKTAHTIKQMAVQTTRRGKNKTLRDILAQENVSQTIIFCNQKKNVSELARSLKKYEFDAAPLHGDLSQMKRNEVLAEFKKGSLRILVASDVAARGLDVEGLSHVFNFDVPHNNEDYVHRIGRTGRAGHSGKAISLLTLEDQKTWVKIIQSTKAHVLEYGTDHVFAFKKESQLQDVEEPAEMPKKSESVKPKSTAVSLETDAGQKVETQKVDESVALAPAAVPKPAGRGQARGNVQPDARRSPQVKPSKGLPPKIAPVEATAADKPEHEAPTRESKSPARAPGSWQSPRSETSGRMTRVKTMKQVPDQKGFGDDVPAFFAVQTPVEFNT